jgi:hypothetical protein
VSGVICNSTTLRPPPWDVKTYRACSVSNVRSSSATLVFAVGTEVLGAAVVLPDPVVVGATIFVDVTVAEG